MLLPFSSSVSSTLHTVHTSFMSISHSLYFQDRLTPGLVLIHEDVVTTPRPCFLFVALSRGLMGSTVPWVETLPGHWSPQVIPQNIRALMHQSHLLFLLLSPSACVSCPHLAWTTLDSCHTLNPLGHLTLQCPLPKIPALFLFM